MANKKLKTSVEPLRPPRRVRKLKIYSDAEPKTKPISDSPKKVRAEVETPDGRVNEVLAARILGLKVRTLQNRRSLRQPPAFEKIGRKIWYRREALEDYLDQEAGR